MTRYLPLLLLAGVAAEIASIIWIGRALGVAATLLLLFAGGAVGISLVKGAGANLADTLRSPVQGASLQRGLAGETLARVLAGLLFLVPGFFSDAVALLLLLPLTRRWLSARFEVASVTPGPRPSPRYDKVIEGEAVEIPPGAERPQQPGDKG